MDVIGLLVAAVIWMVLCWLGLVFVTVPVTFLATAAGLIHGAALAVIGYVRIYHEDEDEAVLARPDAESPRGHRAPYPHWDEAWPGYLSRQVERDVRAAVTWPGRRVRQLLAKGIRRVSGPRGTEKRASDLPAGREGQANWPARLLLGAFPLVPAPLGYLVGVTAGAYAGWAVLAAAVEGATAVPRCARLCAIWALRAVDASVRWWRGAAVTCPGCRYVAWLPAYHCDKDDCPVVHRDVRPGRLGVWVRRCRCATHLPTTVLRAARVLVPVCPNCGGLLHPRAGVISDARIALSGGPAVGKTRLLVRAAAEMTRPGVPSPWEPADAGTTTWLSARQAPMTGPPGEMPGTPEESGLLAFRHSARGKHRYFYIADLNGKRFETDRDARGLWDLGTTRRHLLVLDPTILPSVRDRIGSAGPDDRGNGGNRADYAWTETSLAQAELPYRLLVAQLNRLGARTRRCSLALVITKADRLAAHGLGPGQHRNRARSRALREWLRTTELHTLAEVAEHDFARVRCFLVGEGQEGAAAPFEWLLRQFPRGAAVP